MVTQERPFQRGSTVPIRSKLLSHTFLCEVGNSVVIFQQPSMCTSFNTYSIVDWVLSLRGCGLLLLLMLAGLFISRKSLPALLIYHGLSLQILPASGSTQSLFHQHLESQSNLLPQLCGFVFLLSDFQVTVRFPNPLKQGFSTFLML